MAQQHLHNGILPQMETMKSNLLPGQPSQKHQFNGMNSSAHSSRDPSPSTRFGQIPSSQLPPRQPSTLASQQLPPASTVSTVTRQVNQLNISDPSSPVVAPKFGTSTPNTSVNHSNINSVINTFSSQSVFSPITPASELGDQQKAEASKTLTSSPPNLPPDGDARSKQQTFPIMTNVVNQNQGHNVNASNFKLDNLSSSQSTMNPISQAPFRQIPLGPASTRSSPFHQNKDAEAPRTSQNVFLPQQSQTVPPLSTTSQSGILQQHSMSYVNQAVPNPSVQPPRQNVVPNFAPRLATSASQPKLLPSNSNLYQIGSNQVSTNQPLASQNNYSSTPNLYQSSQVQNGPPPSSTNKPPQTYQVPQTNRFMNQQRPSLYSNRYPSANATQPPVAPVQNQNIARPVTSQQQFDNNQQQFHQQSQVPPLVQNQNLSGPATSQHQFNNNQQPYGQQQVKQYPQQGAFHQQQKQYNQQQVFNQQQGYPAQQQPKYNSYESTFSQPNYPGYKPSVASQGFNKMWGNETHDLLQTTNILPPTKVLPHKINLGQEALDSANCSPDIFRCTMTKIPESNSLLQKSRLPLGILIHPFKDLSHLPVIQCNVIVRCRACRTYINPFVYFVDNKRWKCNLCYRINELPEEFQYDPVSKTYGDPSRRPEVRSSTIEYIAPAEYMLRPPQPAVYLFLLDISRVAVESGYLHTFCGVLLDELKNLPGDARTQIGFVAYDSALHFFSLAEGLSQPHEMTILDIDDVFLPCPDNLLVNLKDRMELVIDLLNQLPMRYVNNFDNNSALGAALQVAHKMMAATGGRVTVFQSALPNLGPGALSAREIPTQRSSAETTLLNPANDFYKRLSLDCNAQQIAVDLFTLNSQFVDLSTISGISRFSAGCMYHFPLFKAERLVQNEAFERSLRRYLTRKIGFEAVMRIRCTRGLSIHTFHGNFFVRSTDLLSLPNVNPDAGYGMQVAIDESLSELQTVCFQVALLYTSSKGERRIRVHTLCLPTASTLHDIINSADQQCIVGLLAKMAVDRSLQSSLSDAREAFINVAIDILSSYRMCLNLGSPLAGLLAPECLKLMPLYISALLKCMAFRTGVTTRLDDRIKSMMDMKTKPLGHLMQQVYPDLYPVHNLEEQQVVLNSEEEPVPQPPRLQLTARCLDSKGAFLMDTGEHMMLYVCAGVSETFLNQILGVANFTAIPEEMCELPILENPHNKRLHQFVNYLNDEKPFAATIHVIRDNSSSRLVFLERLIEDRLENALSYHEFLQHLKSHVK